MCIRDRYKTKSTSVYSYVVHIEREVNMHFLWATITYSYVYRCIRRYGAPDIVYVLVIGKPCSRSPYLDIRKREEIFVFTKEISCAGSYYYSESSFIVHVRTCVCPCEPPQ